MSLLKIVDSLPKKIRSLLKLRDAFQNDLSNIKRQGYTLAKPHWRGGRQQYLYLIHPMVDGSRPGHEYIGADKKAQDDALARIERGKRFVALSEQLELVNELICEVESHVAQADEALSSALKDFK